MNDMRFTSSSRALPPTWVFALMATLACAAFAASAVAALVEASYLLRLPRLHRSPQPTDEPETREEEPDGRARQ